MKENQSWPTKEFSEKTKKVHFQRVFATFYCSKSKCAPECQVLGKSVDWFITTCKWDGRQLLHYSCANVEETHSTGKDIFFFTKIPCALNYKSLNCMFGISTKRKFIEVRCSWRPNVYTEICVTKVCDSSSVVARGHWSVLLACDNDRWNTPTNALGATSHITSHNPLCYGDWPLDTFRCKQLLWCTMAPQFDVLAKMVIWK